MLVNCVLYFLSIVIKKKKWLRLLFVLNICKLYEVVFNYDYIIILYYMFLEFFKVWGYEGWIRIWFLMNCYFFELNIWNDNDVY